jgi:hypothetical protein
LLASSVTALPSALSPRSLFTSARDSFAYKKYAVGGALGALGSFFLRVFFFLPLPISSSRLAMALVMMFAATPSSSVPAVPPRMDVVWLR